MPFDEEDFNFADDVIGADADDKCKLVAEFDVPQPTPPPLACVFLFSSTFELYFSADLMGVLLLVLRCWTLCGVSALVVALAPLHDSERVDSEKFSKARRMEEVERRCRREKLARALVRRSLATVDFVVVVGERSCCCCSSMSSVLLVSLEAHDMCSLLEP